MLPESTKKLPTCGREGGEKGKEGGREEGREGGRGREGKEGRKEWKGARDGEEEDENTVFQFALQAHVLLDRYSQLCLFAYLFPLWRSLCFLFNTYFSFSLPSRLSK